MQFNSVHGAETHSRYLATLGFWSERTDSVHDLEETEKTFFLHKKLIEPVSMNDNAKFDAIIGFDILKYYDFSFEMNRGLFTLKLGN